MDEKTPIQIQQEKVQALKDQHENLLRTADDLQNNGKPERIAFGYRWGSTSFFFNKQNSKHVVDAVVELIIAESLVVKAERDKEQLVLDGMNSQPVE